MFTDFWFMVSYMGMDRVSHDSSDAVHVDKLQQFGWLKLSEVATRAKVSRRTIDRMRVAGQIPAVKFRGVWRVPESWLLEQEEKARAAVRESA